MFKNIDIFTERYIQIIFVLMLVQTMYQYMHIPHSTWLITAICSIYAGFDPNTVQKKAYMRVKGTFVGIAVVVILWYFIHFDYRVLIILITLWPLLLILFTNLPYSKLVILNTAFSDMCVEWSNSTSFSLSYYISDRIVCTLIVFSICITVEQLWFKKKALAYLTYYQAQKIFIKNLASYFEIVVNQRGTAKELKINNIIVQNIDKLTRLVNDADNHEYKKKLDGMLKFSRELHKKMTCLNYLEQYSPFDRRIQTLSTEIKSELASLESMVGKLKDET